MGNVVDADQITGAPTIQWDSESDALYTLIVTVSDYTSTPFENSENLQWLVVNISGNDVDSGTAIAEFYADSLLSATLQRYTYLVFKQVDEFNFGGTPISSRYGKQYTLSRKFSGQPKTSNFIFVYFSFYSVIQYQR